MRKFDLFKNAFVCICALIFALSGSVCTASAEEMPSQIAVEWYSPNKLRGIKKEEQKMVISTEVNGKSEDLFITFPSFGGFRFNSMTEGIFKPESCENIVYTENPDGTLTVKGKGDTVIVFNPLCTPWAFQVFNQSGNMVAQFGADQIWFGYQAGELKKVKLECGISENEVLYGLGERFGTFNQVGVKTLLWNRDAWSDNDSSYKNIPLLHSSVGYMLFFNSTYSAVADIGVSDKEKYSLDFSGPKFDFYIWTGTPLQNISSYTSLTGTPMLLPKWAFRYWSGASGQTWTSQGQENVLKVLSESLDGYEELGITDIAALYGEYDLASNINAYNMLLRTNTRMLDWTTPFQSRLDMSYWLPELSVDIEDNELPAFKNALNPWTYLSTDTMDFTHPNAKEVMRAKWKQEIEWGLKGLMVDYGEYVPEDVLAYNGMTGLELHNFFAYYYTKAFNEIFTEEVGEGEFVLFARNAAPGSQKWAANFGGDQQGNFEGLKKAVNALLTISACGFSTWGTDIGGYGETENQDVYMRWLQFGTFNPLMRLHGLGQRDPWHFGDRAADTFVTHYWLRENILDKIYSSSIAANKTGVPMSRSMAVAYPARESLLSNQDQYIFCDDFLVCPVTEGNAYYRTVSLPLGDWTDLWTGQILEGGKDYDVDAPQNYSPVYIKSGSVIPVKITADTLNLFKNMNDGNSTQALLITAPNGSRTSEFWNDTDTKTVYTSSAKDGTITVSADRGQNADVVILPGLAAAKVTVDGIELKESQTLPEAGKENVYYIDSQNFRTVISVAEKDWRSVSVKVSGTLNNDLAYGKEVTAHEGRAGATKPENLVDGDVKTNWVITDLDEAFVTVDTGSVSAINQVVLKWCDTYGEKYSVQVSQDGSNWSEVAYIEDGDGMIDNIKFDAVNARYVKICDIESNFGRNCTMYSLSVYASDKPADAPAMEQVKDETDNDNDKEQTVKWTVTKRRKVKNTSDNDWYLSTGMIVLICSGTAVIVAGGIVSAVVIHKKRKKHASVPDETNQP